MHKVNLFEKTKSVLADKGIDSSGLVINESFLRIEKVLKNTTSVYDFNLKDTSDTEAIERKLDINDSFLVGGIALAVYKRDKTAPYNEELQFYPNPQHFTGGTNFSVKDLEVLYKGSLEFKVGNTVNAEALSTLDFRHVPETQQTAATNHAQFCLDEVVKQLSPNFLLRGSKSNSIKLTAPMSDGALNWAHDDANQETRVVLYLTGMQIKGMNELTDK